MKKVLIVVSVTLFFALFSISVGAAEYDLSKVNSRTITINERMGRDHIMGRTQSAFADALAELSEGKIKANKYLDGELEIGSIHPRDVANSGMIDVSRIQLEMLNYLGYERGTVFGLPFLFEGREHFWKFANSEVGEEILAEIRNQDWQAVPLAYIEEGARHFFTTYEVNGYEDLADKRIRVQTNDIYVSLVETLGASATPLDWTEIYTALSTGIVSGAENPYSGYDSYMLYEVAPYFIETGHIFAGGVLSITEGLWNSLNETEKELFKEAAQMASDYNREAIASDEAEIKEKITEEYGVKIIELNAEEKDELYKKVQPIYQEYAGEYEDLINEINNLK